MSGACGVRQQVDDVAGHLRDVGIARRRELRRRARLEHLYRSEYQFAFSNLERGFCVTVRIPFQVEHAEAEPIRIGAA